VFAVTYMTGWSGLRPPGSHRLIAATVTAGPGARRPVAL